MMRRLMLAGLLALGCSMARAGDDVVLREDRPLTPALESVQKALPKPPDEAPLTEALKQDIGTVVRHVVYPLTDKNVKNSPKLMSQQVEAACEGRIRNFLVSSEVRNTEVQKEFLKVMKAELTRVVAEPQQDPITRVNAARVAARLAALSASDETVDLLVKIVDDPKQVEGARYYGCQGLKELFTRAGQKGAPPVRPEKQSEAVTELVKFIERPLPYKPNTEEEAEGLRVLRREAIRALAESRDLAGALALCKIAGKDKSLELEPRLDEMVEAAVGLLRLPADPKKDYQPGYAAFFVAKTVQQFATTYKARSGRPEPWKVYAARMRDGLAAAEAASAGDASVKSVVNLCEPILKAIESDLKGGVNIDGLDKELQGKQPAEKSLFKSDEKAVVTPREPTAKEK